MKTTKILLLFLGLICIILVATNPTESQFKDYLAEDMKNKAYEQNYLYGRVMEVFSGSSGVVSWINSKKR